MIFEKATNMKDCVIAGESGNNSTTFARYHEYSIRARLM